MRFFVGDDNGQLKSVKCAKSKENEWKIEASVLDDGGTQGKVKAVQRLAVMGDKIALARADGTAVLFCAEKASEAVQVAQQWQEARFRQEHQYIGLDILENGDVISCTSAGHLRLQHSSSNSENGTELSDTTSIPNRLCELILSDDGRHFAYGGDEVEVSVWDTTRAFGPSRRLLPACTAGTKRRKDHTELIEGETWRAKNVPNDFLNLRQPVHNTTLTFLSPIGSKDGPSHHILTGTRIGSVRRYDTRAARKPVADWKDVGRVGGVRKVQRGTFENQAFVADHGGNLFALDLRTGRVLYAYSGIAGAISSLAPTSSSFSPPLLASTSRDRYFRLHSAYMTPNKKDGAMDKKGEVLGKHWIKSAAECVAWDGIITKELSESQEEDGEEDDVWAGMQDIGEEQGSVSESDDDGRGRKNKQQKVR